MMKGLCDPPRAKSAHAILFIYAFTALSVIFFHYVLLDAVESGALNKDGQPGYHDNGIVLNGTKKVLENASLHDNGIVLNGTKKVLENASLRSPSGGTKEIDDTFKGDQFPSSINFVEPVKSHSATSKKGSVIVDD